MVFYMPDRIQAPSFADDDGKLSPPDWQTAAPALDFRWFIAAALLMPMLLALGVYWIRTSPIASASSPSTSTIEVRLINLPDQKEIKHDAVPPAISEAPRSDVLIDDTKRTIPNDLVTSLQPESEPLARSSSISAPASPVVTGNAPKVNQTAVMFQRALLTHIAKYRHYPDQARRDRAQGIVQVVFAMRRNGTVTDVWVKTSSGHSSLDHAAVDTILKAQPLPSIPVDMPDPLNIAMPVDFSLP